MNIMKNSFFLLSFILTYCLLQLSHSSLQLHQSKYLIQRHFHELFLTHIEHILSLLPLLTSVFLLQNIVYHQLVLFYRFLGKRTIVFYHSEDQWTVKSIDICLLFIFEQFLFCQLPGLSHKAVYCLFSIKCCEQFPHCFLLLNHEFVFRSFGKSMESSGELCFHLPSGFPHLSVLLICLTFSLCLQVLEM